MKSLSREAVPSQDGFSILEREIETLVSGHDAPLFASSKEPAEPDHRAERELSLIFKEAEKLKGLSLEACARLLSIKNPLSIQRLCAEANLIKERVFGKRIVLFAPLYLSNYCLNGCLYCGFRSQNREAERKALTEEETVSEAGKLEAMGFKRILLVTGEDPRWGLDYIIRSVRAIYKKTSIRIIHVNAAAMTVEELKELKRSGVGVYQVFQETYHRPTFEAMHPSGRKKDYALRTGVMDRALIAGFDDVGIGALLGLYDYRFDCLSVIAHSKHLYSNYGTHAHTISVPRLRPAQGSALPLQAAQKYVVTDEDFKKITAVYRLAVPSAGVVVSTREPQALRGELIRCGVSQMSAASRTDPGGYAGDLVKTLEQFSTNDRRSLNEVMEGIIANGAMPSLCTTCYRTGRVGGRFAEIAASGNMEKFCQANAVLTLKEYTIGRTLNKKADVFEGAIREALKEIKEPQIKEAVEQGLKRLEKGKRDIYL